MTRAHVVDVTGARALFRHLTDVVHRQSHRARRRAFHERAHPGRPKAVPICATFGCGLPDLTRTHLNADVPGQTRATDGPSGREPVTSPALSISSAAVAPKSPASSLSSQSCHAAS
jgi:hypothetical protein